MNRDPELIRLLSIPTAVPHHDHESVDRRTGRAATLMLYIILRWLLAPFERMHNQSGSNHFPQLKPQLQVVQVGLKRIEKKRARYHPARRSVDHRFERGHARARERSRTALVNRGCRLVEFESPRC